MNSQILILSILFNASGSDVNEQVLNPVATEFITAPIPKKNNEASKAALIEAFELLKAVEPNSKHALERCRLLVEIAELSMKLGDRDGAKQAVVFADKTAAELKETSGYYGDALRDIAKEWGRLGDAANVLETISNFQKNDRLYDATLHESALAAAESGHYETALQIAKELQKDETRKWANQVIKRFDIINRAKKGITEALLKEVDQLPDENDKVAIYIGNAVLSKDFIKLELTGESICLFDLEYAAGNRKQAIAMVQKAEESIRKIKDQVSMRLNAFLLARVYALLKDPASIRKIVQLLPPIPDKNDVKYDVYELSNVLIKAMLAAAEAAAGNIDSANDVVKEFSEIIDQAYVMMYIGLALQKEGSMEKANVSLRKAHKLLEHSGKKSYMYHNLATAEALCGDFEAAIVSATTYSSDVTFCCVAGVMSKAGRFQDARKLITGNIQSEFWQGTALMTIAESQTKAGQDQEVRKWIAEDDNQIRKAYATVGLAKGLYKEKSTAK